MERRRDREELASQKVLLVGRVCGFPPARCPPPKGTVQLKPGAFSPPTRRPGACAQNNAEAKCRGHFRPFCRPLVGSRTPRQVGPRCTPRVGIHSFFCQHRTGHAMLSREQEMLSGSPPVTPLSHSPKNKKSECQCLTGLQKPP